MYYKVLSEESTTSIEREVNRHLAMGYKLHGDTFVTPAGRGVVYTQAMVKEEK